MYKYSQAVSLTKSVIEREYGSSCLPFIGNVASTSSRELTSLSLFLFSLHPILLAIKGTNCTFTSATSRVRGSINYNGIRRTMRAAVVEAVIMHLRSSGMSSTSKIPIPCREIPLAAIFKLDWNETNDRLQSDCLFWHIIDFKKRTDFWFGHHAPRAVDNSSRWRLKTLVLVYGEQKVFQTALWLRPIIFEKPEPEMRIEVLDEAVLLTAL